MKTMRPQPEIHFLPRINARRFCLPLAVACTVLAAPLHAQEKLVTEYPWKALVEQGKADASLVREDPKRGAVCAVVNPVSQPLRKTLLVVESPAITTDFYRLSGEIRYEGVEGDSYLEMWSTFPPATPGGSERNYFSRTLAEDNQMGKIHGTSDWREFSLPFNAAGSGAHPIRLTFNLVLVGKGTVSVSGMKLWQTNNSAASFLPNWTMRFAGNSAFPLLISLGVCSTAGALVAAVKLRRRYQQSEERRMAARDILA